MIKTRFSKLIIIFITIIISISLLAVLHVEEGNKVHAISTGQANIAARADYLYNIQWTAQKTVKGWNNETTYTKGKTYRLPYGQPSSTKSYIYWDISINNFLNSTKNASSEFYTKRSSGGGSSVYYSIDCSAFASYCWGLSSRNTTSSWSSLSVTKVGTCNSSNINKIEVGDALNWAGHHVVIISDVTYSDGKVSKVEITEQTVPQTKRTTYSASQITSNYSSYTIYRYNKRDSVTPPPTSYIDIPQDNYYLKNSSTGTYLNISDEKAANGQAATLSAKQNSNSFKFYASGSKDKGYYLLSLIDKNYALNPYSDTPGDGTKITLYKKSTDGTQLYFFEPSGSGYIIHNAYNENLVLTPSGSNVLLKTRTGAANQVWVLESANTTTVKFHRNTKSDDTTAVSEKFTVGVANQKFGYNTDGTGRYGEMNAADVGFGRWTNPGYKLLGWSTDKNATTSSWATYSAVTDNWIKNYAPSVNLYAVWQKIEVSTTVKFHRNIGSDDTTAVSEIFTTNVANQKFGYKPDGTGRYGTMNDADVGFGEWTNPGYKLLGWSTDKNATTSSWATYSAVTDNWIQINTPTVDLYAVWQKETQLGDLDEDEKVSVSDVALLQKYLVNAGKLTETQCNLADMNGDGKLDVFDFIILKRITLKTI